MVFKPGKSGNPSGRPKALQEVVELGRANALTLMNGLIELATNHPDAYVRIAATGMVFDRTFGKPKQQIKVDGEIEHRFVLRLPGVIESAGDWERLAAAERDALPQLEEDITANFEEIDE